ncbi:hypothetical protein LLJM4_03280 [Lactococcus cremoris]|uniref:hypothetical protein n=1 Tax=Lactococcus lactis subsp. cremoris TaxID=1359 RepID=UPI00287FC77F|nr:hypothetical protein [Lactococcus cremoris]WMB98917.1 hypothetical protein LLJM4_03280 [Lactococcus cremoris]
MAKKVTFKQAKQKDSKINFEEKSPESYRTRISFNFSYLISNKKYNHEKMELKVHKKFLERICALSTEDFVVIKSWKKEEGFEAFKIDGLNPPSSFINSGRDKKAGEEYWVFRLSKLGRVICKRIETTFYIIAIDTKFDLYEH